MKRNYSLSKKQLATIACILVLSLSVAIEGVNFAHADVIPTFSFLSVNPKLIGLGQYVLINGWVDPPPPLAVGSSGGIPRQNYFCNITKPDGTVIKRGPFNSTGDGTYWFTLTMDQVGTWSIFHYWPGDSVPERGFTGHGASQSPVSTWTVQSAPAPLWPDYPLPTGYWSYPVMSDNRAWWTILGDWRFAMSFGDTAIQYGFGTEDVGNKRFNPYSPAPNSSHILWTLRPQLSGYMGGDAETMQSYGGGTDINLILGGLGFYQQNGLHCVEVQTGKELWVNTAQSLSPSVAQVLFPTPEEAAALAESSTGGTPSLWYFGSNAIVQINARNGNNMTVYGGPGYGARATTVDFNDPLGGISIYQTWSGPFPQGTTALVPGGRTVVKWNSAYVKPGVTGTNNQRAYANKTVWVQYDIPVESGSSAMISHGVCAFGRAGKSYTEFINATTGAIIANRTEAFNLMGDGCAAWGKFFYACIDDMKVRCWDMATGNILWASDQAVYPWGAFWAYGAAAAYNRVYFMCYDGHVYCFDANTGKTVWKFYSGDAGSETPYGTWPFYGTIGVADGKVYAATYEHSPSLPFARGRRLYCLDANNGNLLWSIAGQFGGPDAIAAGVVLSSCDNNGVTYAFGKGQTQTSVQADSRIGKNSYTWITGTVVDLSPAQPNTPAVPDSYMDAWMDYLHQQKPLPPELPSDYPYIPAGTPMSTAATVGVPVQLSAVDSSGKTTDLGTVNADLQGVFSLKWTPPNEDVYRITAYFPGTNSYWSSYATTTLAVGPATPVTTLVPVPTPTPSSSAAVSPTPTTGPVTTSPYLIAAAAIAVVVIIAVIVAAIVLRRRKK